MWYKNVGSVLFRFVTKQTSDRRTDEQMYRETDRKRMAVLVLLQVKHTDKQFVIQLILLTNTSRVCVQTFTAQHADNMKLVSQCQSFNEQR